MAVPVLHLNLAPRPSLWRQRHQVFGWIALGAGLLILVGAIGFTWRAYHQANRAGRDAVSLTEEAKRAARQEQQIQASLQDMDATREQSRWKLAERILQERSLPWSRLTSELEQCMVPDMRLKGLQRARSNSQQVVMKLKGEARTREAEAAFVESLRATPVFAQVILERESERTGGGWDFEISLPTAAVPPPFQVKAIKLGPATGAAVGAPTRAVATPLRNPVPAPARAVAAPAPPAPPTAHGAPPLVKAPEGLSAKPVPPAPGDDEEVGSRRRRPARVRTLDPRTTP
jgi:Tfp pilus assembly protein PilN